MPTDVREKVLAAERLREVLHYDPNTGLFRRKVKTSNRIRVGELAGSRTRNGYLLIGVGGLQYRSHRLAWLYVHGRWPIGDLDHRDRDRTNNRINNLRETTRKENMENGIAQRNSATGIRGVYWDAKRNRWAVTIHHHKKTISGGRFDTLSEAVVARRSLERQFFTHAPGML